MRNLEWKAAAAVRCLDRSAQVDLFADASIDVARTPGSPPGVHTVAGGPPSPPRPPRGHRPEGPAPPGSLVLTSVKRIPDPIPWKNWSASEGSISYAENGMTSDNTFTRPPSSIAPGQSFEITTHSTVHAPDRTRLAGGMTMAGDFTFEPSETRFDVVAEATQTTSGGKTVRVTAPQEPRKGVDYVFKVWVNFYVGYEYHYAVR
jgi:hypothetical protein